MFWEELVWGIFVSEELNSLCFTFVVLNDDVQNRFKTGTDTFQDHGWLSCWKLGIPNVGGKLFTQLQDTGLTFWSCAKPDAFNNL